jgi:DNA-binding transcriptional ArsR family regulator
LSQHLALLRTKSLVSTRKQAQTVFYSVADGPIRQIIQTLHDIYCPNMDGGADSRKLCAP